MTMKQLNESTITRLLKHSREHCCAMLTAFRQFTEDDVLRQADQNNKDNLLLGKALRYCGYGITKVIGSYAEQINGKKPAVENSWFVVDLKDDPNFVKNIIGFGAAHSQDSVLIIPKNGFFDAKNTYLVGTNPENTGNDCFVKWQEKKHASEIKFSKDNDMLTKIRNKSFYFRFDDEILDEHEPLFKNFSNAQETVGQMRKKYGFMFKQL